MLEEEAAKAAATRKRKREQRLKTGRLKRHRDPSSLIPESARQVQRHRRVNATGSFSKTTAPKKAGRWRFDSVAVQQIPKDLSISSPFETTNLGLVTDLKSDLNTNLGAGAYLHRLQLDPNGMNSTNEGFVKPATSLPRHLRNCDFELRDCSRMKPRIPKT